MGAVARLVACEKSLRGCVLDGVEQLIGVVHAARLSGGETEDLGEGFDGVAIRAGGGRLRAQRGETERNRNGGRFFSTWGRSWHTKGGSGYGAASLAAGRHRPGPRPRQGIERPVVPPVCQPLPLSKESGRRKPLARRPRETPLHAEAEDGRHFQRREQASLPFSATARIALAAHHVGAPGGQRPTVIIG